MKMIESLVVFASMLQTSISIQQCYHVQLESYTSCYRFGYYTTQRNFLSNYGTLKMEKFEVLAENFMLFCYRDDLDVVMMYDVSLHL